VGFYRGRPCKKKRERSARRSDATHEGGAVGPRFSGVGPVSFPAPRLDGPAGGAVAVAAWLAPWWWRWCDGDVAAVRGFSPEPAVPGIRAGFSRRPFVFTADGGSRAWHDAVGFACQSGRTTRENLEVGRAANSRTGSPHRFLIIWRAKRDQFVLHVRSVPTQDVASLWLTRVVCATVILLEPRRTFPPCSS
jgi:hypothetical protein